MLQEKIECQCQQRRVLVFLTVSGHQKQQQNDQKVFRIEILGKQLPEELSDPSSCRCGIGPAGAGPGGTGICVGMLTVLTGRTLRFLGECRRTGRILWGLWLWAFRFWDPVSAVTAIGLGNITVIHPFTSLSASAARRNLRRRRQLPPSGPPAWPAPAC